MHGCRIINFSLHITVAADHAILMIQSQVARVPAKPDKSSLLSSTSGEKQTALSESSRIKRKLIRVGVKLSLLFSKARLIADATLSSDEIEDQLFDSSSVGSSVLDPSISEEQEMPENIIQEECAKMREIEEPFVSGEVLWERQRRQWLSPLNQSVQAQRDLEKRKDSQDLKHLVDLKDYAMVYDTLVLKGRKLKRPMNLRDLLKVVNAGWTEHKNWDRAAKGLP